MPVITLQGCKHPILMPWKETGDPYGEDEDWRGHVTCMVCYERLIQDKSEHAGMHRVARVVNRGVARGRDNSHLKRDQPAGFCPHHSKNIIHRDEKFKHGDYTDALCEDCGCVLRHPEGPGGWEEVIFNGLVIREEP